MNKFLFNTNFIKRSKQLCLFLFFILFFPVAGDNIKILYTGNTNGIPEYCRCPTDNFGGLTNIFWYIDNKIDRENTLIVDSGDFFSLNINDRKTNKMIKKIYDLFPFDAYNIGDQDFVVYDEFLKYKDNIVSSNIKGAKNNIIVKKNNVIFSIYGIIDYGFSLYGSYDFLTKIDYDELNNFMKSDKEKGYITILLSHYNQSSERKLFLQLKYADIVISGHNGFKGFEEFDDRIYAGAGDNSEFLGLMELNIIDSKIIKAENKFVMNHKDSLMRSELIDKLIKEYYLTD